MAYCKVPFYLLQGKVPRSRKVYVAGFCLIRVDEQLQAVVSSFESY